MQRFVTMCLSAMLGLCATANAAIINVPTDQPTIQGAITASANGDEIIVAPGTYNETINMMGRAITLRSTDPLDPAVVAATIIDAQQTGTVITCDSNETNATVISGFTIRNGSATAGGGMRNFFASPTVTHCVFRGNVASSTGGGMYNHANSSIVRDCDFFLNSTSGRGAGMSNAASNAVITNCTFIFNVAATGGGAVAKDQGGNTTFANCLFKANTAAFAGGMFIADQGSTAVANCVLAGNGSSIGGELLINSGTAIVTNCIIRGSASVPIMDNTLQATITFCNVKGGYSGVGNIDVDPMFVNEAANDYRLLPGSDCIDAGTNFEVPAGLLTDPDGEFRFRDAPGKVDTGSGTANAPIVDIGIYEYQPVNCPSDGDGDGDVDLDDLQLLLFYFGTVCS